MVLLTPVGGFNLEFKEKKEKKKEGFSCDKQTGFLSVPHSCFDPQREGGIGCSMDRSEVARGDCLKQPWMEKELMTRAAVMLSLLGPLWPPGASGGFLRPVRHPWETVLREFQCI